MATFLAQIEGMTQISLGGSSNPTNSEVSNFLTDGAKDVINKLIVLRPDEAFKFAAETTVDTGSGIEVKGRILSVVRENGNTTDLRPASPMSDSLRYLATDKSSLHYRTAYNPGFYILNGKVFVVPVPTDSNNSAVVSHISYPTVAHGDSAISGFPDEHEHLVILYASAISCMAAASNVHANLPTKVTKLEAPIFGVNDVILPSTPSYLSPALDFDLTRVSSKLGEEDMEMAEKEMELVGRLGHAWTEFKERKKKLGKEMTQDELARYAMTSQSAADAMKSVKAESMEAVSGLI